MRKRALRPIATLLSLMLAISTTAQAGPISVSDVVQVVGRSQNSARGPELRLRGVSQGNNALVDDSVAKSTTGSAVNSQPSSGEILDTATGDGPPADSILSGVALSGDAPQGTLDVISQGDLEGSICDCGEIPGVEGHGGIPKWPLLFLAAIPFFFIHHHCDTCKTPPPPPPPPGVPEPASMFLMGSGLAAVAAGLRRRHARKNGRSAAATEEA